jgi:hypothetical protein
MERWLVRWIESDRQVTDLRAGVRKNYGSSPTTQRNQIMKSALFAVCLIGVTFVSGAKAQGIGIGVPAYGAPVYAAPIYPSAVYPAVYSAPLYTTTYAPPVYPGTPVYYSAPAAVYAAPAPYAVSAPVVVGAPIRVYGHWGRHHGHVYYRW